MLDDLHMPIGVLSQGHLRRAPWPDPSVDGAVVRASSATGPVGGASTRPGTALTAAGDVAVQVTPTGYSARCRDHGPLPHGLSGREHPPPLRAGRPA